MSAGELKAFALPALLAGTSRQTLRFERLLGGAIAGDDRNAGLKALALTGQALRFERPARPASFTVEEIPKDERPIVPDGIRRPLIRLLAGRKGKAVAGDDLVLAVAFAFARLRLRPHPFDLPRLSGFVAAHAERLGATAQHFAEREKPVDQKKGYFEADALDERNWTAAPLASRARFIGERRGQDADAALALVSSVWAGESAEARLRLLKALQVGLGPPDRSFLEELGKDRAPRVRDLALRLLSRLAGRDGHPALKACLDRIKRSSTGLFRKRTVLSLELPANIKDGHAEAWLHEAFADVGYDELARALSLSEAELIEASQKDGNLLLALAVMATRDRRLDLLERVVGLHLPQAFEALCRGFEDLSFMTPPERLRFADIVLRPQGWSADLPQRPLSLLHRQLEGPLGEASMGEVLRSKPWLALRQGGDLAAEAAEILVALCPQPLRAGLRQELAGLDPAAAEAALQAIDILDAMEKVKDHG